MFQVSNNFSPSVDNAYAIASPTTGSTVTMTAGQSSAIITPAGTLTALTVVLPVAPPDGQIARIVTTQIITTLTVTNGAGATMANAFAVANAAGNALQFLYTAIGTKWYRIG